MSLHRGKRCFRTPWKLQSSPASCWHIQASCRWLYCTESRTHTAAHTRPQEVLGHPLPRDTQVWSQLRTPASSNGLRKALPTWRESSSCLRKTEDSATRVSPKKLSCRAFYISLFRALVTCSNERRVQSTWNWFFRMHTVCTQ